MLTLPLIVLECAALGMGVGLWLAAVTAKYRDLRFALPFLSQLWMFATPVVYPASLIPERYHWLLALNPMAGVAELTRYAFFGAGTLSFSLLAIGACVTVFLLLTGIMIYNRVQRNFIDTV